MKTLLHHKGKHLYFKGLSEWTNDVDAAFDFGVVERAVKFVRDAKLSGNQMELILAFHKPCFNVTIPIDQRFEATKSSKTAVLSRKDPTKSFSSSNNLPTTPIQSAISLAAISAPAPRTQNRPTREMGSERSQPGIAEY